MSKATQPSSTAAKAPEDKSDPLIHSGPEVRRRGNPRGRQATSVVKVSDEVHIGPATTEQHNRQHGLRRTGYDHANRVRITNPSPVGLQWLRPGSLRIPPRRLAHLKARRRPARRPLSQNDSHLVEINNSVHEGIIPHGQSPAVQPAAAYGGCAVPTSHQHLRDRRPVVVPRTCRQPSLLLTYAARVPVPQLQPFRYAVQSASVAAKSTYSATPKCSRSRSFLPSPSRTPRTAAATVSADARCPGFVSW